MGFAPSIPDQRVGRRGGNNTVGTNTGPPAKTTHDTSPYLPSPTWNKNNMENHPDNKKNILKKNEVTLDRNSVRRLEFPLLISRRLVGRLRGITYTRTSKLNNPVATFLRSRMPHI